MKTVSKLPAQVFGISQDYNTLDLPKSQEVIGRLFHSAFAVHGLRKKLQHWQIT
jgi:uncharacterized protein (DUF486 family)